MFWIYPSFYLKSKMWKYFEIRWENLNIGDIKRFWWFFAKFSGSYDGNDGKISESVGRSRWRTN